MAKISSYPEEASSSPNGWLLMAVEQPDGTFHTKKVAPDKIGAQGGVGPQGPQGANGPAGPAGPSGSGSALLFGSGVPASGLGVEGNGYIDLRNGDLYVKDAVDWQVSNNAGLGIITSAEFLVVGGAGVDESDNILALVSFLESNPDIYRHAIIRAINPADSIQINKTISIASNNTVIEFRSPVIYGPDGAVRFMGTLTEITRNGKAKGKLLHTFSSGQTTIHLDSGTSMEAVDFAVGDLIIVRGQNDINGKALSKEIFHVTNANVITNELTVAEAADGDFQPTYPLSDWQPDHTTGTTVSLAAYAALTVDAVAGDMSVTTNGATLGTSGIAAGAMVMINTNEVENDLSANAAYYNAARMEMKTVVSADFITGIVEFDSPLVDSYATAKFAGLTLISPVINSEIRGLHCLFSADQTSRNIHPVQLGYCYKCKVRDCHVSGATGQKGNGVRVSDSLECEVHDSRVSYPKYNGSAEGYGFAIYTSDKVTLFNCTGEGCRHNFLVQKANHTSFDACVSINDGISGFDLHGVRSFHTHFRDCRAYGGPLLASNNKSAFRIGNTSHTCGDYDVLMENCYVFGCNAVNNLATYTGTAFEMFGASHGVVVRGCSFSDCSVGMRIGNNSNFDSELNTDIIVEGCEFKRMTTMLDIDGESTNKDVRRMIFSNNTSIQNANHFVFIYCTDLKLIGNRVLNPVAAGGVYAYNFNRVDRLTLLNNEAYGTNRGLSINTCTNVVLGGNKWFAQADSINFLESGTTSYSDNGGRSIVPSSINSSTSHLFHTVLVGGDYLTVPSSSGAPDITQGVELISTTYTAKQPGRLVKVHAVIPLVATGTATNTVCHIFVDGVAVGTGQMRLGTTGAGSGSMLQAIGTFFGTGASQAITFRYGATADAVTLTIAHEWTSGAYKTGTPYLIIEEAS